MSLAVSGAGAAESPASSGRNSPVPRVSRVVVQDEAIKADKNLRRYASNIERILSTWETAPDDWADYIAFLSRLLKTIQSHPKDVIILPHSDAIASRLSQCLNATLPSGVHQKALEVYGVVFELLGLANLATHLSELLPGLSSILAFASLSVRPSLYVLYEDYIVLLSDSQLRPALKSLTLSLLPALEDESSEDFDRAFSIACKLEIKFSTRQQGGYFWQCIFLAVITSPGRRQGALNLLIRRLPNFGPVKANLNADESATFDSTNMGVLSNEAHSLISPDPGLLIRCFVRGLSDQQLLVQRGFLDLLISHLPLHSPVLQELAVRENVDRLIYAATKIVLRRDMGLNRRLWAWFLGPPPKDIESESQQPSPVQARRTSQPHEQSKELLYFTRFGLVPLEHCLLESLTRQPRTAVRVAQSFRICLSLMDRWEIGGSLVPRLFLPAIRSVYDSQRRASENDVAEMLKSARLFFDGIESKLIWSDLFQLLPTGASSSAHSTTDLDFFHWIIQNFNMQEEEMLTMHIPNVMIFLAIGYLSREGSTDSSEVQTKTLQVCSSLLQCLPERIMQSMRKLYQETSIEEQTIASEKTEEIDIDQVANLVRGTYDTSSRSSEALGQRSLPHMLCTVFSMLTAKQLTFQDLEGFKLSSEVTYTLMVKMSAGARHNEEVVSKSLATSLIYLTDEGSSADFAVVAECIRLTHGLHSGLSTKNGHFLHNTKFIEALVWQVWQHLSPYRPKYHLEAVRLIWQIDEMVRDTCCVQVSLINLMRPMHLAQPLLAEDPTEALQRFAVLWTHSIQQTKSPAFSGARFLSRRSSSTWSIQDAAKQARQQNVLEEPLWLCLAALGDSESPSAGFLRHWLGNLPSLDHIVSVLVAKILELSRAGPPYALNSSRTARQDSQRFRELVYYLGRLQDLIMQVPQAMWTSMSILELPGPSSDGGTDALMSLTSCIATILSNPKSPGFITQTCASLIGHLLSSPLAEELRPLQLEAMLMDRIMSSLESSREELQSQLLSLLELALKVRLGPSRPASVDEHTSSRPSTSNKAGSGLTSASGSGSLPKSTSIPPEKLLACIRAGFSSRLARLHMERWLEFLGNVLTLFSDAIFTNLMPLVDCFCGQLQIVFHEIVADTSGISEKTGPVPEATIGNLLKALEMVLAKSHQSLLGEASQAATSRPPDSSSGLFGGAAQNRFRASGLPSKTSQANSRLAVVLAFHDATRACLSIWTWASQTVEISHKPTSHALTTSSNALKIRNRSRQLLEEIFNAELLECLEVVIEAWSKSQPGVEAETILRLLQTLACTRPKSAIPAILDALCSRTNPGALAPARQSSITVDLGAAQIALFLLAYLRTMEDDAMDEIWSDCITFMRDVLANPMPYRQALPPLLTILVTMSLKLGNTNFGEQRKMRKDIADLFQRLLSAISTTTSAGSWSEPTSTAVKQGSANMEEFLKFSGADNATVVMADMVEHLESIVESQERVNTTLSTICSGFVSPLIHAKAFPSNVGQDVLLLLNRIARKAPASKHWRKEVADAYGDVRFFSSQYELVRDHWLPVLQQWAMHDRERIEEIFNRMLPPSSAGIMFGVGATTARLDADRKTQFNLRRICLLMLAAPRNLYVMYVKTLEVKLAELFDATSSSSPSCVVKAELFMLLRAAVLTMDAVHIESVWPIVNEQLQRSLASLLSDATSKSAFTNLSLLQACKLLDLLLTLDVDEFQPYEWLYITDTSDAVYQPPNWKPSALADQVSEVLTSTNGGESLDGTTSALGPTTSHTESKQPMIQDMLSVDSQDIKALSREDFARTVLRPFLSQFSIHSYEAAYGLGEADIEACKANLLKDILDMSTIVE